MTPPSLSANLSASADFPLAVGPAMRIARKLPLMSLDSPPRVPL